MLYLEYYRFRPAFLPFAAIARGLRWVRDRVDRGRGKAQG